MTKKIYLETFEKCAGPLCFTLLFLQSQTMQILSVQKITVQKITIITVTAAKKNEMVSVYCGVVLCLSLLLRLSSFCCLV